MTSVYRISNTHVNPSLLYISDVINPGILVSVKNQDGECE